MRSKKEDRKKEKELSTSVVDQFRTYLEEIRTIRFFTEPPVLSWWDN